MHFQTVFSVLLLCSTSVFAEEYDPFGASLEARGPKTPSVKSTASNVNKPLPALPKEAPKAPSRSPSVASTGSKAPVSQPPSRQASVKSNASAGPSNAKAPALSRTPSTNSASGGKPAAGADKGKAPATPYKAPNLLEELSKKNKDKVIPPDKKWYQKAGDAFKNIGKSKDQKNYDRLHKDPSPQSTPNLKKMINKEAEIMTGTSANQRNLEKWQKPRYEDKLNRIKPQGDVASAQLNIHNNKWKEVKDVAQVTSQLSTIGKNAGVPAIFRRGLQRRRHHQQQRVSRRNVLRARAIIARRHLVRKALEDEELWA